MRVMRCMCGAEGVWVVNDDLKDRMGLECISVVMWRSRLRWFGYVERMVGGNRLNVRPKGIESCE